jgi:hypothetical protein
MRAIVFVFAAFVVLMAAYDRWRPNSITQDETEPQQPHHLVDQDSPSSATPSRPFSCDGKTRCSQMTSCAEATFYLQNCPDVKIDGDHDGIPCEDQLCGR